MRLRDKRFSQGTGSLSFVNYCPR